MWLYLYIYEWRNCHPSNWVTLFYDHGPSARAMCLQDMGQFLDGIFGTDNYVDHGDRLELLCEGEFQSSFTGDVFREDVPDPVPNSDVVHFYEINNAHGSWARGYVIRCRDGVSVKGAAG